LVRPTESVPEKPLVPELEPRMVRKLDPVGTMLDLRHKLIDGIIVEYSDVIVPTRSPALIFSVLVLDSDFEELQRIPVSEIHNDFSQEVKVVRTISVFESTPICVPNTEIIIDPVDARLCFIPALGKTRSYVNVSVKVNLGCCSPLVTTISLVARKPCPSLHTVAVSEVQKLDSQGEYPIDNCWVKSLNPKFPPSNVMLVEPKKDIIDKCQTKMNHPKIIMIKRGTSVFERRQSSNLLLHRLQEGRH
jgi:hypothetical protein